jgi:riboflavin synthase
MKHEEDAVRIRIATSPGILRYVIEKGSVTLDGISLTVTDVTETELEVSIIPHTAKNTTLSDKKAGDIVNIENDIIGKYVDKLMNFSQSSSQTKSGITLDFLRENGF